MQLHRWTMLFPDAVQISVTDVGYVSVRCWSWRPWGLQKVVYYPFSQLSDRPYCRGFHRLWLQVIKLNKASTELEISFLLVSFDSAKRYYASCWRRKIIHDLSYHSVCNNIDLPGKMCQLVQLCHHCYDGNQSHFHSIWGLLHQKEIMLCAVSLVKSRWLGRS